MGTPVISQSPLVPEFFQGKELIMSRTAILPAFGANLQFNIKKDNIYGTFDSPTKRISVKQSFIKNFALKVKEIYSEEWGKVISKGERIQLNTFIHGQGYYIKQSGLPLVRFALYVFVSNDSEEWDLYELDDKRYASMIKNFQNALKKPLVDYSGIQENPDYINQTVKTDLLKVGGMNISENTTRVTKNKTFRVVVVATRIYSALKG